MRIAELAKIVGFTTQEIRHELALVDFGVKPTEKLKSQFSKAFKVQLHWEMVADSN